MKKSEIKLENIYIFTQHVKNPLTGEDLHFDPNYIMDVAKHNPQIKAAWLIHHDKDEGPGEDDHWMGMIITDGTLTRDEVVGGLNLPYFLVKHPYIGKETCPWNAAVNYAQYCTINHAWAGKDGKHKVYYDPKDVIATFDFERVFIKEGKI